MKLQPAKKGATPRQLNERELHYELRRADEIIANAYHLLSPADIALLDVDQSSTGVTASNDPMGSDTRHQALNRITPKPDYFKLALIMLSIFLGWAWYTAQSDRNLVMQQTTQTVGAYPNGDIN